MGFLTDPGMTTVRDHGTLGASLGHGAGGTTSDEGNITSSFTRAYKMVGDPEPAQAPIQMQILQSRSS